MTGVAHTTDIWRQAFPFDEARRAAALLVQIWQELSDAQPRLFNASHREAQLTERLCHYISSNSLTRGRLTGFWINENTDIEVDVNGEIVSRSRKDITYLSNGGKNRLNLIFEFKKIKDASASKKAYAGEDGMLRFVSGRYSPNDPLAVMVGIAVEDKTSCIGSIERHLLRKESLASLKMKPAKTGEYIFKPSETFPDIAVFDTDHKRDGKLASDIVISHFFVNFP